MTRHGWVLFAAMAVIWGFPIGRAAAGRDVAARALDAGRRRRILA